MSRIDNDLRTNGIITAIVGTIFVIGAVVVGNIAFSFIFKISLEQAPLPVRFLVHGLALGALMFGAYLFLRRR
jgi:hypothetical protein